MRWEQMQYNLHKYMIRYKSTVVLGLTVSVALVPATGVIAVVGLEHEEVPRAASTPYCRRQRRILTYTEIGIRRGQAALTGRGDDQHHRADRSTSGVTLSVTATENTSVVLALLSYRSGWLH
jgi:hypothetical protein